VIEVGCALEPSLGDAPISDSDGMLASASNDSRGAGGVR
jgi:hypothetical protein